MSHEDKAVKNAVLEFAKEKGEIRQELKDGDLEVGGISTASFLAEKSANQNIAEGAITIITHNVVRDNKLGFAANIYTVQDGDAGLWKVGISFQATPFVADAAGLGSLDLRVANIAVRNMKIQFPNDIKPRTFVASWMVDLIVGDTVAPFHFVSPIAATAHAIDGTTLALKSRFWGYRVGDST